MDTARHQIVPRALGRRGGQNGRLHFHEATVGHTLTDGGNNLAPQDNIVVHFFAPEVQKPVPQPHVFREFGIARHLHGQDFGLGFHVDIGDA